tara:strand:- start:993 stop:2078 length:1086 start_codon:yes stop_codon:yes gene_type:complete
MSDPRTEPEVSESLTKLIEGMAEEAPELMAILNSAKGGELSEAEAMAELMAAVQENPALSARMMELARDAFLPTKAGEGAAALARRNPTDLKEIGDEAFFSGVGLPQMNPLVEAAIAERLQFDGDIPEMRHGPMPPGVMPAVPVRTKARNPAAVGSMLDTAAKRVRSALDESDKAQAKALERVAEAKALAGVEDGGTALAKMAYGSADTDLATYRRGEVPAPVTVKTPTGTALARMSEEQQKEHSWRFLSTTQGRRTAMETLRDMISKALEDGGVPTTLREYNPKAKTPPLAFHEWKVNMSGPGSMQPAFSMIDTAAKAITHHLLQRAKREDTLPDPLYLEVIPVNTVDIRSVGWAARLVP